MPTHIHISRDGQILGFYPQDQILALFINGTLDRSVWVWHEGLPDWQPISEFVEQLENDDDEDWNCFIETFDQDIAELQDDGTLGIIREITAAEKGAILEKAKNLKAEIGKLTVQKIVFRHFPCLLTDWGRDEMVEEKREADKRTRFVLSAIESMPPREDGERPLTEKQADFLRDLGFPDQDLPSLGIKQASAVISATIKLRDAQ